MNQLNKAITAATEGVSKVTLNQLYTMANSLTNIYSEIMWSNEPHNIDDLIAAYELSQSFAGAIEKNLELAFPGMRQLAFNKRYGNRPAEPVLMKEDG